MSDENNGAENNDAEINEPNKDETKELKIELEKDYFLQNLVSIQNNFGFEFGLTVTVGGLVVSGTAITGKAYLETMAGLIKNLISGDYQVIGEAQAEKLLNESLGYQSLWDHLKNEDENKTGEKFKGIRSADVFYLHMKDVIFYHSNEMKIPKDALWRCKISAIDSFMLGSLEKSI